jgi:streptothricin acetyltransferase
MEYKTLTTFEPDAEAIIEAGYQSQEHYQVTKEEAEQETTIHLELVPFDEPYTKRWEITDHDREFYGKIVAQGHSLAAYDGTQLVGLAIAEVRRWNQTFWIWEFHVAPSHKGRGIGREMMSQMTELALSLEMRTMLVETQSTNLPAIRFYRAVGFSIEGVDLSYYTNQDAPDGEVAIFMKKRVH